MPVQAPQWCDLLCCCICYNVFDGVRFQPVSLVCGHTACRSCLLQLKTKQCPFDQSAINIPVADLPQNMPILRILECHQNAAAVVMERLSKLFEENDLKHYLAAAEILDTLALYLRRAQSEKGGSVWSPQLSRPMQRKLVTLLCCQLAEPEGRGRALKAIRSLGERSLMELLLLHQNPYHLSSNLWAAVRGRGCQFLGPAMQEEVLKLVLLALSEGALISRKVLVMYIVQTLEKDYPQASKTSVGHVVQLLYRASCFNVIKRDGESSLMQLKEEFRNYESLRREHDAQIVQIAMEAGLRISPDQWSALLYGDQAHKSHMQSIIDRLQTPQSFAQSMQELLISLQRTGDPGALVELRPHYELLADIDSTQGETVVPSWNIVVATLNAVKTVMEGQVRFCERYGGSKTQRDTTERSVVAYKFKTSMCRDIGESKTCPRGDSCTFAHSLEEMERYRARSRLMGYRSSATKTRSGANAAGNPAEMNRLDEFGLDGGFDNLTMDENEGPDDCDQKRRDQTPSGGQIQYQHMSAMRQSSMIMTTTPARRPLSHTIPVPVFPPPTAFQTVDDATPPTPVLINTPPPHFGPTGAALMMQWPANTAVVNTPNGPMALGSAQTGAVPVGAAVRYQVFRPGAATPAGQPVPTAVPVAAAAAPAEYGYYWCPPAPNVPGRANVYHPGDVLHLEVPLARVVPTHHPVAGNMPPPGAAVATAIAGSHFPAVPPFPDVPPTVGNTAAAQTATFGNHPFAQTDLGTVYFYPQPQEHNGQTVGALTTGTGNGQCGLFIGPGFDDILVYSPHNGANVAAAMVTNGGVQYGGHDQLSIDESSDQRESMNQRQSMMNATCRKASASAMVDGMTVSSAISSSANMQLVVSSSSSSKATLSSCVPPCTNLKMSDGTVYARKESSEKETRLIQLEMKKDEIIKRLTWIKKETPPLSKSQQQQQHHSHGDEYSGRTRYPRLSSESDPADSLSASIATSVLQDDYPVNYAAAVLRGRQGAATTLSLPSSVVSSYGTSGLETSCWSSLGSAVDSTTGGNNISQKRTVSADGMSTRDYQYPWRSTGMTSSWAQTRTTVTSTNGTMSSKPTSSEYYYATRPYIPDEHIDIKHLTDESLRKELQQLPTNAKRLHYVRLELEAREADSWRSEDDQVIPFSTSGPQVSRYGPISRAGNQRLQSAVMTCSTLPAVSVGPSDAVLQVKGSLHKPLPTATVQPTKEQPVASRADVDPTQIVSTIPQVFKLTALSIDPATVDEKLEKLVEVKTKLASIPLEECTPSSSAEKEQLKVELELIDKEISTLDERMGEECLLKALENVNITIEELHRQQKQNR